jgi:hypothetical protein
MTSSPRGVFDVLTLLHVAHRSTHRIFSQRLVV